MVQSPVFHANGDDPEAVVHVVDIAIDYRNTFRRDVVIDLVCYRRYGHNEGDEPSYTQPLMYQKIKNHASVARLYGESLVKQGHLTAADVEALWAAEKAGLERAYDEARGTREGVLRRLARRAARAAPPSGGRRARAPRADRPRGLDGARGLRGPPEAEAAPEEARRLREREARHRLGRRRDARVRDAAPRGHARPPLRAGLRPRHVQPPPRGPRGRRERRGAGSR